MSHGNIENVSLRSFKMLRKVILLPWLAGVFLASTVVCAELPVAVPQTTAAALARMRDGNIHGVAFRLLELAIPLLFLFTGLGARLRQLCESISGRRWFWTVTLFACAYLALAALIALPFDFYAGYVESHAAGTSKQSLTNCLTGEGLHLVVRLVVMALLILLPYVWITRSPRRWWLYGSLALIPVAFLALVVLPAWIKPPPTYKPLEDRALATRIETLATLCGVATIPVLVGRGSTGVDRLGPTNRIILQTNLASVESPAQIEFTIGHELKLYVMGTTGRRSPSSPPSFWPDFGSPTASAAPPSAGSPPSGDSANFPTPGHFR